MPLTEQTRHRLHHFFEERMGEDVADEFMAWLPRGELATKADIEQQFAHLREVMDLRFSTMATAEALERLRGEMHNAIRLHTIVLVGALGSIISVARIF